MKKVSKKVLSLLISAFIIFGAAAPMNGTLADLFNSFSIKASALSYSSYSSVPIDSYQSFRDTVIGKAYNVDDDHGAQCWDGACILWKRLGSNLDTGRDNARGCWNLRKDANAGSNFELIYNISDVKRGDVVVFDYGDFGHIGFADENYNGSGRITLLAQNQANQSMVTSNDSCISQGYPHCWEGAFCVISWSVGTFLGAFRYKGWAHTHDFRDSARITKYPTRTETGTRVRTCSCGKTYTQTIPAIPYTTSLAEGIYVIKSKCNSNWVIATNQSSGYNLFLANFESSWSDQYWILNKNSDGTYSFENLINDGYVFDVYDNSMVNLGNLGTYPRKTSNYDNERFYIIPSGSYYKLVNKKSYNVVDAEMVNGSINAGSNIIQYEDNGGDNQLWLLSAANPSLTLSSSSISISEGSSANVTFTVGREMKGHTLTAVASNTSVCTAKIGSWSGMSVPVTITGITAGSTTVTLTLKDKDTGVVFGSKTINVTVSPVHTYSSSWSKNGTQHWHQCTHCDAKKDVANHTYTSWVSTQPTCTSNGVRTYQCTVCGYSYTSTIAAVGHSYGTSWLSNTSQHWHQCTVCGTKKDTANHTFEMKHSDSQHWYECTVCGYKKDTANHTFPDGSITCSECGYVKTTVNISITNNASSSQTVTFSMSDDSGIDGYYWGTNADYESNRYTTVEQNKIVSLTKSISSSEIGTYYLTPKTSAGNVLQTKSIIFRRTTLSLKGGSGTIYVLTANNNSFVLPNPTKNGFDFLGWSKTDSDTVDYLPESVYTVTGHSTLYAVWKLNYKAGENIMWSYNSDNNELIFTGYGDMYDFISGGIPWSEYKSSITKITLDERITKVGNYSFSGCTGLTGIELPNGITSIGNYAFGGCTGFTKIKLPNSITSIGNGAFMSCTGLTEIKLPNNLTYIGESVFENCTGLTSIKIPNGITDIKEGHIFDSTGITNITIPTSVKTINYRAFRGCSKLKNVYYEGSKSKFKEIKWTGKSILYTFDREYVNDAHVSYLDIDGVMSNNNINLDNVSKTVYGINPGTDTIDLQVRECTCQIEKSGNKIGTGSKIVLYGYDNFVIDEFDIVVFGDTDGDSIYDGNDAVIVNFLANGMLTKEQVGEAVYIAADCNHDGVIDNKDVEILNQAGLLLAEIDQTKTEAELQTDSEYMEYTNLIDQTPEIQTPQNSNSIFTIIISIITYLKNIIFKIFG